MTTYSVHLLSPQQAQARRRALVDLLVDSVEGGASVGFVWPMTRAKAETWWEGVLASHAGGERLILGAEGGGHLDGTVQLIPSPKENQAFSRRSREAAGAQEGPAARARRHADARGGR
jgi:hypothetical protein